MQTETQEAQSVDETAQRKMWVGLTAAGFVGRFYLPEKHFNDLLTWLVDHRAGQGNHPNDDIRVMK